MKSDLALLHEFKQRNRRLFEQLDDIDVFAKLLKKASRECLTLALVSLREYAFIKAKTEGIRRLKCKPWCALHQLAIDSLSLPDLSPYDLLERARAQKDHGMVTFELPPSAGDISAVSD